MHARVSSLEYIERFGCIPRPNQRLAFLDRTFDQFAEQLLPYARVETLQNRRGEKALLPRLELSLQTMIRAVSMQEKFDRLGVDVQHLNLGQRPDRDRTRIDGLAGGAGAVLEVARRFGQSQTAARQVVAAVEAPAFLQQPSIGRQVQNLGVPRDGRKLVPTQMAERIEPPQYLGQHAYRMLDRSRRPSRGCPNRCERSTVAGDQRDSRAMAL